MTATKGEDEVPPLATSSNRGSMNSLNLATNLEPGIFYSTDTITTKGSAKYLVPEEVDDGKQHFGSDENKERGNWSGRMDFLLSCLGYAVGLGNVWRFPYLCYRNGGGAFFIPYIIMLVFVGIPLFFMELCLGQFCSSGPLTCWKFAPLFRGTGVAQLVVSGMVGIYYNMIIAWSIYYLFASFTSHLPWSGCDNPWNSDHCVDNMPNVACNLTWNNMTRFPNGTCYSEGRFLGLYDYELFRNETNITRISASEEYYDRVALDRSEGIHDMGAPRWQLVLCLLASWLIAFLCMIKGIKSSGKVVYVTALFPYVVLVILLIRGATLPNAGQGVYFYVVPKWERLLDAKVWNDAAVQIFFSLSNCWGGLITLASYNRFHNNCLRDTFIVALGNCGTSVFAGFVIFSFLGYMAGELNTTVEEVVDSGAGLAFIVYPDAVSRMPVSPLWSILFFLMLLTLGLDSQFAMLETVLTSILDQFNKLRPHKTKVILVMCIVFFLLGLPLTTRGGVYMLQLMDTYCGGWAILMIGISECVAIGWVYGSARFFSDIEIMIGKRPWLWWRICWQFFSPILIVFILLFTWIDYSPARYGDYMFPLWADAMGWLMTISSVIWIPILALYQIWREEEGNLCYRVSMLTLPTEEWGPALVKHRKLVDYVHDFVVDPWETGTRKELQGQQNWAANYGDIYGRKLGNGPQHLQRTAGDGSSGGRTPGGSMGSISHISTPNLGRSLAGSMGSLGTQYTQVSFESVV